LAPCATVQIDYGREEQEAEGEEQWEREKLGALPSALRKRPTWDELEQTLASKFRREPVSAATLQKAAKAVGLDELPASYVEYTERLSTVHEWLLTYAHDFFPRILVVASPQALKDRRKTFLGRLDHRAQNSAKEGPVATQLKSLVAFGSDTSRMDLCWDPSERAGQHELGICFVDRDADWSSIRKARTEGGNHLLDVLKYYRPYS
jgi:hypothetical protein